MTEVLEQVRIFRARSSGDFDEVMRLLEKRSADETYWAAETRRKRWEAVAENQRLADTQTDAEKLAPRP